MRQLFRLPGEIAMSQQDFKRLSTAIALVALVLTAPNWLNGKQPAVSGYDAPWIYPSLSAATRH
jgi:hypothetical protein